MVTQVRFEKQKPINPINLPPCAKLNDFRSVISLFKKIGEHDFYYEQYFIKCKALLLLVLVDFKATLHQPQCPFNTPKIKVMIKS